MRFKCGQCGHVMIDDSGEIPSSCTECGARLRPAADVARAISQPVIVQTSRPPEPFEFFEEKIADLRDRREARQEQRRFFREDRDSNLMGIAGFAINAVTFLLVISSWLFAASLPMYPRIAGVLAVPAAILGLVLSTVASFLTGRRKTIALCGVIIGVPLLLFMVPLSFLIPSWLR